MIDTENIREHVAKGLNAYLQVPVIRSNQNAPPPSYPYIVYTITTVETENNGTYGIYDDGIDRIAVNQVWSVSAVAATAAQSVSLASRAREWLQHVGTVYLNDNDVIVQKCTNITNRDNVISIEYEYKNGFDVTFWAYSEVAISGGDEIDSVLVGEKTIEREIEDNS